MQPYTGVFKTRNGEMVLKIIVKVVKYYRSSKTCNCCPIYSAWGRSILNFAFSGRGVGVWTLSAEKKVLVNKSQQIKENNHKRYTYKKFFK